MIDAWLELPTAGLFAILVSLYTMTGAVLPWLVFRSPLRRQIGTLTGVVAPFFSSIAVLFSLLTGFLASDIADRNRQAWRAVNGEASAIQSIHAQSLATTPDMAAIRTALQAYAEAVVSDEWPKMDENLHSARTDSALSDLLRTVSDPAIAKEAGQAMHNALLAAAIRLRDARADRLSIAFDRTSEIKWVTVLVLGIMTQVAIALVHLERPRAHIAALTVFSSAAVIALGLIAMQEHPFSGALRISPAPLQRVISLIVPPG